MENLGWLYAALAALFLTSVSSLLLWWGNNRYFSGRFDQWQQDIRERLLRIDERIQGVHKRIEGIEVMRSSVKDLHERIAGIEVLHHRTDTNEAEISELRKLKHDIGGLQKAMNMLIDLIRHKI